MEKLEITICNMHKYSEQEVFDYLVGKIFKQGERSATSDKGCVYLCEDGKQCVAGPLIPSGIYKDNFEGNGWQDLISLDKVPGFHSKLISSLQTVHDTSLKKEEWKKNYKSIADRHNLKWHYENFNL